MRDSKHWSFDGIRKNKGHQLHRDLMDAIEALKDEPGEWVSRDADYEIAWYVDGDARVVLYPHKTTAGNHHIRCRLQGKDIKRAAEIQKALQSIRIDCSFQMKGQGFKR